MGMKNEALHTPSDKTLFIPVRYGKWQHRWNAETNVRLGWENKTVSKLCYRSYGEQNKKGWTEFWRTESRGTFRVAQSLTTDWS